MQPVRLVEVLGQFISSDGYSQDGMLVVVENPNPDLAVLDTQCRLNGYDGDGAITETDKICRIPVLFPGERRTICRSIYSRGSKPATRLEFEITEQGEPARTSLTSACLHSKDLKFWPERPIR